MTNSRHANGLAISAVLLLTFLKASANASTDQAVAVYLQTVRGAQTMTTDPGVVQRQLVLLRAAVRLDRNFAQAYEDVVAHTSQIGRGDMAMVAAQRALLLRGSHTLLQMKIIDMQLGALQTVEAKRDLLQGIFVQDQTKPLPEVISDVYRQLGELAWQSYQTTRAREYFEMAIKQTPQNLKAYKSMISLIWQDGSATLAERNQWQARSQLAAVAANPLDLRAVEQLTILAGNCGLTDEFLYWNAARVRLALHTRQTMAPRQQLHLAEAAMACGQYATAEQIIVDLLKHDEQQTVGIRISAAICAQKTGNGELLSEQEKWVEDLYGKFIAGQAPEPDSAATAAIYFAVFNKALKTPMLRAVKLSGYAYRNTKPHSHLALLSSALALVNAGEISSAKAMLDQMSPTDDVLVLLARTLIRASENDAETLKKTLTAALPNITPGPVADLLADIWKKHVDDSPPKPDFGAVAAAFAALPPETLSMPYKADQFCKLTMSSQGDYAAGDFVTIDVTIENTGTMPLNVGPASFLHPVATVDVIFNDAERTTAKLNVPLQSRQVLDPARKITGSAFLDQATIEGKPLTEFIAANADKVSSITLRASLAGSVIASGIADMTILHSNEIQLQTPAKSKDVFPELLRALDDVEKLNWQWANHATRVLQDPAMKGRTKILVDKIAVMAQSADDNRAAILAFVLRYAEPSSTVFNALGSTLARPKSWLCRLLALDSLAILQGATAENIYQFYGMNDTDDLVRQLAAGYLMRRWDSKK